MTRSALLWSAIVLAACPACGDLNKIDADLNKSQSAAIRPSADEAGPGEAVGSRLQGLTQTQIRDLDPHSEIDTQTDLKNFKIMGFYLGMPKQDQIALLQQYGLTQQSVDISTTQIVFYTSGVETIFRNHGNPEDFIREYSKANATSMKEVSGTEGAAVYRGYECIDRANGYRLYFANIEIENSMGPAPGGYILKFQKISGPAK